MAICRCAIPVLDGESSTFNVQLRSARPAQAESQPDDPRAIPSASRSAEGTYRVVRQPVEASQAALSGIEVQNGDMTILGSVVEYRQAEFSRRAKLALARRVRRRLAAAVREREVGRLGVNVERESPEGL